MSDEPKYYIAYAIAYCEAPCGCDSTRTFPVYDKAGMDYEHFATHGKAEDAARALMQELDYDNWSVIACWD